MKYLLTLMFFMAVSSMSAQLPKYNIGDPWPKNGYKFFKNFSSTKVSLQRYADNDTLYYLKLFHPMNSDGYHFLTVSEKVKDSILISEFNHELSRQKQEYIGYYNVLLSKTQAAFPATSKEWTFYKTENRDTLLTTASAIELYRRQHEVKKNHLTPEQYVTLIRMFGEVFSVMAAGADTRTQYDKVMQSGGW